MSDKLHHEIEINEEATKPEDIVPLKQKIAYGMGVVSDHYANVCLSLFLNAFFVDFMKLAPTLVGNAMGAARFWDAFTDPLAGTLSDRCKSKWGRRKPFIFVGALLTGLCFPVLWMVPEAWAPTAKGAYLLIVLLLYYTFYSIFSVPYEALGTELTPDYKERNRIFVVRSYVQQVFNLGIMWIFPLAAWLAMKPWVGGEINGVRYVSWGIAAMIICAGIVPSIVCVERYQEIAKKQKKAKFLETVKGIVQNKPLLIVIGTICTYLFTIMATMNLAYFVNVYYVYGGEIQAGAILGGIDGTLRFFFAIASAYSIKKLTDKFDKHHMMMGCVSLLLVTFIGIYFTTIPGRPWLTLVMKPFLAIGEVGFWVLIMSMRADVCDWDEYRTGTRNEGMIAAATNWVNKLAITLAFVVAGIFLQHVVRFDTNLPEEVQTRIEVQAKTDYAALPAEEKEGKDALTLERVQKALEQKAITEENKDNMQRLRICYTMPQVIALAICLFLLSRYPLSHERLNEIRAELEKRRGETIHE